MISCIERTTLIVKLMFKSSLCDCGDAYILVKKTISVIGQGTITAAVATDRNNKQVLFKNCAPFTDCIS